MKLNLLQFSLICEARGPANGPYKPQQQQQQQQQKQQSITIWLLVKLQELAESMEPAKEPADQATRSRVGSANFLFGICRLAHTWPGLVWRSSNHRLARLADGQQQQKPAMDPATDRPTDRWGQ